MRIDHKFATVSQIGSSCNGITFKCHIFFEYRNEFFVCIKEMISYK